MPRKIPNESEVLDKLASSSSKLRITGITLVLCSLSLFLCIILFQSKKIEIQHNVITKKDSIITNIQDSTASIASRKDTIISIINNILYFRSKHQADSIESFLSDTVKSYFKNLKNVPKEKITDSDKRYWSHFPDDKFIITEPIQVLTNLSSEKAIIKGRQCYNSQNCKDEIVEIHFDEQKKINYVRAFYAK
ncbi:hypothetical protein [Xanthocytophaga flava]|uniref:hypothetical protein n=1 Tax=Xanthocytophaga flava TaxID=3048013 RepID=UPI0028CFED31|nr:hypothetical protein [Xanthocytophaga flavus]MDJ1470265.1 hypothetical protein [Xanthocytophaga flavus]